MKPFFIFAIYVLLISLGAIFSMWIKGSFSVILLAIIVFFLYTLTLFLTVDAKGKPINARLFLHFLRQRRRSLMLFLFSLVILSLLILRN